MRIESIDSCLKIKKGKYTNTIVRLAVMTLISAVVLLLYPVNGTILFSDINNDFVVFHIIGNAWSDGYVPYERFFDNKGPVLYLIQVFAGLIAPGKLGVWILELIWSVIIFELIFQCGKILSKYLWLNYFSIIVAVLFFAVYESGNSVEMWSLPFELLSLYLVLKAVRDNSCPILRLSLICGLCFGVVSLIRINDNCTIAGLAVGWIIYLCRHRRYKDILYSILYFTVGITIVVLPFLLYFHYNDALDKMLYANFVFNWHYKGAWIPSDLVRSNMVHNALTMWFCLVLPVISYIYDKRNRTEFCHIISFASLVTFLTFLSGATYGHYFLMALPMLAMCVQQISCLGKKRSFTAAVFLLVLYGLQAAKDGYIKIMDYWSRHDYILKDTPPVGADFIEKYIPENQRDSVYTLGDFHISGALYYCGNLPCGKYFFIQGAFINVDNYTRNDIVRDFNESNALWVLSTEDDLSFLDFSRYQEITVDSTMSIHDKWRVFKRLQ